MSPATRSRSRSAGRWHGFVPTGRKAFENDASSCKYMLYKITATGRATASYFSAHKSGRNGGGDGSVTASLGFGSSVLGSGCEGRRGFGFPPTRERRDMGPPALEMRLPCFRPEGVGPSAFSRRSSPRGRNGGSRLRRPRAGGCRRCREGWGAFCRRGSVRGTCAVP